MANMEKAEAATAGQAPRAKGFMRLHDILKKFPVSRSTWWAGVKNGRFPKGVKIGANTTAWRVEDIDALIRQFDGEARS